MRAELTRDRLCELLDINTETGIFTWKHTMGGKAKKGQQAGVLNAHGYIMIRVDQVDYLAHRLMWLYVYGAFPILNIDHIDRNRSNNRPINLRLATPKQNGENRSLKSKNFSGYKGVYLRKNLKDSTWKGTKKNVQFYKQIFELNKVDRNQFYKQMVNLESHPVEFKALMDSVEELSKREKNKPILNPKKW